MDMNLDERYARQTMLQEIGIEGQKKLLEAKVLVVGAGGLGAPILLYLAASGVGTIGIMDDDVVSESNLQRQVLYDTTCLGKLKVEIARLKLQMINPNLRIHAYETRLTAENSLDIVKDYDVVVDATDNLLSRYVINDACAECGKPYIYGSICEFKGQASVFNYKGGPHYRDLYEYHDGIPEFKQPLGVVGPLPGVIGSIEAIETIKVILGKDDTLSGKLLIVDLLSASFKTLKFA